MDGEYGYDLFHGTYGEKLMNLLGDIAYRRVFSTSVIYKMEMAESVMLDFLLDKFVKAVIDYDTDEELARLINGLSRLSQKIIRVLITVMQRGKASRKSCISDFSL